MLNRLAHGTGKEHRRGVRLGHLLPGGSTALALGAEVVGNMRIRCARRVRDIGVHMILVEKMRRVLGLGLLRRVGVRLIRRCGMGRRRLLIRLIGMLRWREAGVAAKASLGEIQGGVRVGARRPQCRHVCSQILGRLLSERKR